MYRCRICNEILGGLAHVCGAPDGFPHARDPMLGQSIEQKYRIEAALGAGTSGSVYRARQLNLHRDVAIKLLHPDSVADPAHVEQLKREALAVARLRHPNVISIIDFGVAPDVGAYLVMELLDGQTLRDDLAMTGPLPPSEAVALLLPVCGALAAVHEAGIVHRDLKPSNLFVTPTPAGRSLKILDFGIATLRETNISATTLPGSGGAPARSEPEAETAIVGTPLYMAPEQCNGETVDARADVYALGCILYELLTGRPPFVARSVTEVIARQRSHEPLRPSYLAEGIPQWLDDVVLHALAKHPSRRFQNAGELAQALTGRGTRVATPPDDDAPVTPNNLAPDTTTFIGRTSEVAEVAWRLAEARLVTLTGPGGIGKTRLSREVARVVLDRFPGGVWLVELAGLNDAALVPTLVAQVAGIREEPHRPVLDTLCDTLANKPVLLVLDNCEHLIEACAELVAELLRTGTHLRVLATSREVLDIEGEAVWSVPPLPLAAFDRPPAANEALRHEAIRLFVNRAQSRKPGFALTDETAADVATLCQALEGIPLAIELAAARVATLSVKDVLARMDNRFRILEGGSGGQLPRHRTLRAALDWSFDLLLDDEKELLLGLSVFAGGFSLDAAEEVCSKRNASGSDVFDALRRLVNKSLVNAEEHAGGMRYRILETVREYAREKLFAKGLAPASQRTHCAWVIALAGKALAATNTPRRGEWNQRLESEHDNLREALRWSVREAKDAELGVRLTGALYRFWITQGYFNEGRQWFESALALDGDVPAGVRADALYGLAVLAFVQTDHQSAGNAVEQSIELYRSLDDRAGLARALTIQSMIVGRTGRHDLAYQIQEESLALSRALGLEEETSHAMFCLGLLAMYRGAFDQANQHFVESLGDYRARGNEHKVVVLLHNLGEVAWFRHRFEQAADYLVECLALAERLGSRRLIADTYRSLARATGDLGDAGRAYTLFAQSLELQRAMGNREGLVEILEGCACVDARRGEVERAVCLAEAAAQARREHDMPPDPGFQKELDRRIQAATQLLSVEDARVERARGAAMPLDAAIDLALAGWNRNSPDSGM